ncbi:MAG: hypothetical protein H6819_10515 [Phycisphaerales bacterium]|nr:hypothetical protein [Phycisphaerales bacterium]MCB9855939.1 hypothetical protein [Phycisphaerales bacterium]MCB9864080.1 hypothetical protein [Phycisphaerales bacterium]
MPHGPPFAFRCLFRLPTFAAYTAVVDPVAVQAYNALPMRGEPTGSNRTQTRRRSAPDKLPRTGIYLTLFVMLASTTRCIAPGPEQDAAAIREVRRQLIVLPVRTGIWGSGFPTHPRNVVCAAHVLNDADFATVAGRRMYPFLRTAQAADPHRARADDWAVLACMTDCWHYNDLDPDHDFQIGEAVFIGGFTTGATGGDAEAALQARSPKIIMGRIIAPRAGDGPRVKRAVVPPTDTAGMSGGPVAVLGADGRVCVVGIYSARGVDWDGLNRRQVAIFLTPDPAQWQPARFARRVRLSEPQTTESGPRPDYLGTIPPPAGREAPRNDLHLPDNLRQSVP